MAIGLKRLSKLVQAPPLRSRFLGRNTPPMKITLSHSLLAVTTFAVLAVPSAAPAAVVFADDYSEANGTAINGKLPDVGAVYSVTEGAANDVNNGGVAGAGLSVLNGQYISDGAKRVVFADFNSGLAMLGVSTPLLTAVIDGNFFRNTPPETRLGGLSLFTGATERFFIGDRSGALTDYGVEFSGGGTGAIVAGRNGPQVTTFTYNFNTGDVNLYDGATATGTPLLTMPGATSGPGGGSGAGYAIDRIRFINDGGGDISFNSLSFDIGVVPEPSSALLVGVGLVGLLGRRRPRPGSRA